MKPIKLRTNLANVDAFALIEHELRAQRRDPEAWLHVLRVLAPKEGKTGSEVWRIICKANEKVEADIRARKFV